MLEDLLNLAEVERAVFTPSYDYFDLVRLIDDVFEIMKPHATDKRITLRSKIEGDKRYFTRLYGDERRYLQVLINFLNSSLRSSPTHAGIEVVLKLRETHEMPVENE